MSGVGHWRPVGTPIAMQHRGRIIAASSLRVRQRRAPGFNGRKIFHRLEQLAAIRARHIQQVVDEPAAVGFSVSSPDRVCRLVDDVLDQLRPSRSK
jgi:hypothetical protein